MSHKRSITVKSEENSGNDDVVKKAKIENALIRLNQEHPGTIFTIESVKGPPHQPIFTMYFMLSGRKYSGSGTTKQEAKRKAAENYFDLLEKGEIFKDSPKAPRDVSLEMKEPQTYSEWKAKRYSTDNYLTQLMKENPGLEFNLDKVSGPSHQPTYIMSFTINGVRYAGSGNSKQNAKYNAAFEYFKQLKSENNSKTLPTERISCDQVDSNASKLPYLHGKEDLKDYTSRLVREHPGVKFTIVDKYGPPHKPTFVVQFELNEINYKGIGQSIKEAKQNAAATYFQEEKRPESIHTLIKKRIEKEPLIKPLMLLRDMESSILEYLHTDEFSKEQPLMRYRSSFIYNGKLFIGYGPTEEQSQNDAAAKYFNFQHETAFPVALVTDNLKSKPLLPKEFPRNMVATIAKAYAGIIALAGKKIVPESFSCIVMTKDKDMSNVQIVSLAVGSKCFDGPCSDKNGEYLNDCHSEVLVRRAFITFIYYQLEDFLKEPHLSIFEKAPSGKPTLKPNIKFHFYTTVYPCGALKAYGGSQNTLKLKNLCMLRAKICQGDQTVLLGEEALDNHDRLKANSKGKPYSMSCSDKLSLWQYLGLQGSLLTHFISPIYLESFICCKDFDSSILKYLISRRVEGKIALCPPFILNAPRFAKAPKAPLKVPPSHHVGTGLGLVWCKGLSLPEVINGLTGKLHSGDNSSLCKKALFERYKLLSKSFKISTTTNASYYFSKLLATDYKRLKSQIKAAYFEGNLGMWVKKSEDCEDFF